MMRLLVAQGDDRVDSCGADRRQGDGEDRGAQKYGEDEQMTLHVE